MVVGASKARLSLSETADFHKQQSPKITENGVKNNNLKSFRELQFCRRKCLVDKSRQSRLARLVVRLI